MCNLFYITYIFLLGTCPLFSFVNVPKTMKPFDGVHTFWKFAQELWNQQEQSCEAKCHR